MDEQVASHKEVVFMCISGPDQGKRIAILNSDAVIGRSTQSNLLSDDPDVSDAHVLFKIKNGRPWFQAIEGAAIFVDGHRMTEGAVEVGQQIRIGRSFWQIMEHRTAEQYTGWLDNLSGRISSAAGVEKVQGFDFSETFSEVFKKRTDEEVEEYFNVGTRSTTPHLLQVNTGWPKPWVFFKLFTLSIMVYLGFVFALHEFGNPILVPGLISIGSFLIPFSILVLFFEVNVVRNVPLCTRSLDFCCWVESSR